MAAFKGAVFRNIPPWDFFVYRLWETENAAQNLVLSHERVGLMQALNAPDYAEDKNPIENKLALVAFCQQADIPHPELIWHFGQDKNHIAQSEHPMWLKPIQGANGTGNRAISSVNDLPEFNRDCLVQQRLSNHGALAPYSNGNLIVCRVVSGKSQAGDIQIIAATLHMPYGSSELSHDGVIGRIDLETGKVINVRWPKRTYEPATEHPDTKARFSELTIPNWKDAISLAEKAHTQLSGYAFIGWDIAFTPSGPVLLEGNSSWNAEQHQEPSPDLTPLANAAFMEIVESYF